MAKKIYCGNLDYSTTSADLEEMFTSFGAVRSAQVITDRDTGQSKGFGFIEMERDSDADNAIRDLNDKVQSGGRALKVNEARPREDRGGGGGGGGPRRGGGGGGGGGSRGGGGGGGRRW